MGVTDLILAQHNFTFFMPQTPKIVICSYPYVQNCHLFVHTTDAQNCNFFMTQTPKMVICSYHRRPKWSFVHKPDAKMAICSYPRRPKLYVSYQGTLIMIKRNTFLLHELVPILSCAQSYYIISRW